MQCFLGLPIWEGLRADFDLLLLSIKNVFLDAGEQIYKNYAEGQPCKMPFVAEKKEHRHPIILKQRVSCLYIPARAMCMPACMPYSMATRRTICWGTKSKHFT